MRPIEEQRGWLRGVAAITGLDRAAAWAMLTSAAPLVFGPLTALAVASRLSPEQQGYYYTLGSLSAFQFLFDLGLGQAVIQFASQEWSNLEMLDGGRIVGDRDALSRLVSVGRLALGWYGVAAILVVALLLPAGHLFFSASAGTGAPAWAGPWTLLCSLVALNTLMSGVLTLLQGCNQVVAFWAYRFVLQLLSGLALVLGVLGGAGLWTLAVASGAAFLWTVIFLWAKYPHFIEPFHAPGAGARVSWGTEIWPVQWRVAVVWLATFLTTASFTPLAFRLASPAVAGRMGMSVSLANVLIAAAASLVIPKGPRFGVLVAQRRFVELDALFARAARSSLAVAAFGGVVLIGAVWLMDHLGLSLAGRLLPPAPMAMLVAGAVLASRTASMSVYLRAFKREPFAAISLASAVCTVSAAWVLGDSLGTSGIVFAYAAITGMQAIAAATLFRRRRVEWTAVRPRASTVVVAVVPTSNATDSALTSSVEGDWRDSAVQRFPPA